MKKTYPTGALVTVILAGMAPLGGCVTQAKYDRALSANRQAQSQLTEARQALKDCQIDNRKLTDDLDASAASIRARDTQLVLTEEQNKYIKRRFEELAVEYQKLRGKKLPLPPLGINVLPSEVDKELRAFAKDNAELLDYLPKYGMVKLKADTTFKRGSDYVQPGAASALAKLANIVGAPAAERFNIYVAGHTDNIPIVKEATRRRHPDNWYLSVHRAVAVLRALRKAGVLAERLGAVGFGQNHPIAPNKDSRGGNPVNRRVEIWIVPPSRYLTKKVEIE